MFSKKKSNNTNYNPLNQTPVNAPPTLNILPTPNINNQNLQICAPPVNYVVNQAQPLPMQNNNGQQNAMEIIKQQQLQMLQMQNAINMLTFTQQQSIQRNNNCLSPSNTTRSTLSRSSQGLSDTVTVTSSSTHNRFSSISPSIDSNESKKDDISRERSKRFNLRQTDHRISEKLTQDIIPPLIEQKIPDTYDYMLASIKMQSNDKFIREYQIGDNQKIQIINLDLRNENGEALYCICNRDKKVWRMMEQFMTEKQIEEKFGCEMCQRLPPSSRQTLQFQNESTVSNSIKEVIMHKKQMMTMIQKANWIQKYVHNKKSNERRICLFIKKDDFIIDCLSFLNGIEDGNQIKLLPILVFDRENHWIEHALLITIHENLDIGISFKYKVSHRKRELQITDIYVDKDKLALHHSFLYPYHQCNDCLDEFGVNSCIEYLKIGDPDDLSVKLKESKKNEKRAKEFMKEKGLMEEFKRWPKYRK